MARTTTKRRVLLATVELLSGNGISNLTVKDIALHAECSESAINYYFGSKEYLLSVAREIITQQSSLEMVLQNHGFLITRLA